MIDQCHSLEQWTTFELIEECRREVQRFMHHQATATCCSFELFRRAITLRDEYAWCALYEFYYHLVGSWILRSQAGAARVDMAELDALINQAFAKFSRSTRAKQFADFVSIEALLAYLRSCARSVAIDELRSRQVRQTEEPLEMLGQDLLVDDPADAVISRICSAQIWHVITTHLLHGEEERIVLQEISRGTKPQDIQHRYSRLFRTVDEVYRVKHNIMDRLRRNKELLHLLERPSSRTSREVQHAG
jgi:hypothetical protein